MTLFKNRGVAVFLTVVVVLAATLVGVYSTASRYTRSIEAMFYDGVFLEDQGFTQPGINSHLENSENAALGLAMLFGDYPELAGMADRLLIARRELLAAESIWGKQWASLEMRDRFIGLLEDARDVNLSDQDRDLAAQFYSTFNGALIAIQNSRYNDIVRDHLNAQSVLLRGLGASQPEMFYIAPLSTSELTWSWS